MPKVSVVVPAYNAAAHLGEALESVFAQGLDDLEVVVVDDGSTDGTVEVARRFGRGVRVLRQERAGSGRARNLGLTATDGELVAFLDADDIWLPEKSARQIPRLLADPSLGLVFSDMVSFGAPGAEGRSYFGERGFTGRCTLSSIFLHDMISTPTVILRRACLAETGAFDPTLPIGQDTDLWFRLALARPFAVVEAPLVRRRFHPGNTTRDSRTLARCVVAIWERYLDPCIAAEPEMEAALRADLAVKRWHHWFLEGCALLREGRGRDGRRYLARAIRQAPLRARAYPFYLASFLKPGGARVKVSVVIPAFNAERFLAKTLRSVLDQSFTDLEVLVVDDGSADKTSAVAASFAPAVRVLVGSRRGVSAARNEGVRRASGAYVAFMDHDDLWEKEKLQRQVAVLDADPRAAFAFTQARVEQDGRQIEIFPEIPEPSAFLARAYENLVHWNYVPMSSVMARRDRLMALSPDGPFDPRFRLSEDWDLWLRLARRAGPGGVAFVPEPLTRYVILPGRATERMADLRLEDLAIFDAQMRDAPALRTADPARCRATEHRLSLEAGYFLLKEGRRAEARRCLVQALRAQPSMKPLRYWMASWLGLAPRSA